MSKAAGRVVEALETAMFKLANNPGLGHWREELADRRHRFFLVYSYLIVYRHETKALQIVVRSMLRVTCRVSWDCRPMSPCEKKVIQETPSLTLRI